MTEDNNKQNLEVFDYKEFKKWWKDYKAKQPEIDKRNREISEKSRAVLLESEKLVEDWKEGMIARGME